jgi:hypothetical protein
LVWTLSTSCVTLGKSCNFFVSQCIHWWNGNSNNT